METNETCGCCDGVEQLTPMDISNRPGLSALHYRVGTHGTFLATMLARLSNLGLEISPDQQSSLEASPTKIFPLAGLTTRSADPAIGFLDAWAAVADVLTFYQERIATEGFLQTATERRSLLELARLLGYQLRPGVSASTYLAYTLDKIDDTKKGVVLAVGTRAQSVPGPGELPQSFETDGPLWARPEWNTLQPRLSQPPYITLAIANAPKTDTSKAGQYVDALYFQGLATNLKPNDRLLFVFGDEQSQGLQVARRVESVDLQTKENRTRVGLQNITPISNTLVTATTISQAVEMTTAEASPVTYDGTPILPDDSGQLSSQGVSYSTKSNGDEFVAPFETLTGLLPALKVDPTVPPPNSLRLPRPVNQIFNTLSDASPQLLTAFQPQLENAIYSAFANATVTQANSLQNLAALRTKAAVFGSNAPKKPVFDSNGTVQGSQEWSLGENRVVGVALIGDNVFSTETQINPPTPNGQVAIRIQEDGLNTHTIEVDLPAPQTNPTPTPVTGLPDATITNRIDTTGSVGNQQNTGVTIIVEFAGANPLKITFSQVFNTNVILARSALPTVTFEVDGESRALSQGQTLQFLSKGRNVQMFWRRTELAVVVQSPAVNTALDVLALDTTYDTVTPGSWVMVERADKPAPLICRVVKVETLSKAAYNITAKVTQLTLSQPWLEPQDTSLAVARATTVYLQSEKWLTADAAPAFESATAPKQLLLAPTPIDPIAEPIGGNEIELDSLIDGLDSGRWLIVTGERLDIKTAEGPATSGVIAGELVMLARVEQRYKQVSPAINDSKPPLPGDKTHTFLELATPLAYSYKRDTVTVYGNVIKATHGETRLEVLGSGDGSKLLQTFMLKQFPLTFVSAPTPAGIKSTLEVRVNGVLWHENPVMAAAGLNDRAYATKTDNDNKTSVIFGNGEHGARLPTGIENVQAKYRNGIGKGGNVKANQISLLATRPLGVKAVINPLPATGGADRESLAQARRNVPLSVMTLDRLVSVQDYEDFTRTFAGIGKSSATKLSDGRRPVVFITIAGLEDIPIAKTSDLWQNLYAALQSYGDPALAVQLLLRELSLIIISAGIKILPDYVFELVVPKIKTALLDAFSFEKRELGQPVLASQVISTIQAVEGVAYCDLDTLDTVSESTTLADIKRLTETTTPHGSTLTRPPDDIWLQMARPDPRTPNKTLPAQIAYLTPDIQDSLILREIANG